MDNSMIKNMVRDMVLGGDDFPIPFCRMLLVDNLALTNGVGTATFTRSTTGTFLNPSDGLITTAAIDDARFEANGVLLEGASTNELLRSEEFDNAAWTKVRATVSVDAATAPDGTMTADTLTEDSTATSTHHTRQFLSKAASTLDYTFSVFVKVNGRDEIALDLSDQASNNYSRVFFDVSSGVVGTVSNNGFTNGSGTIQALADDWYRCTVSATSDTAVTIQGIIRLSEGSEVISYSGDGVSGVHIWGAQLEELPFASSYIPTTTVAVTRTADSLTIDGANIPDFDEDNTVAVQFDKLDDTASVSLFDTSSGIRYVTNSTPTGFFMQYNATTSSFVASSLSGQLAVVLDVSESSMKLYNGGVELKDLAVTPISGPTANIHIGRTRFSSAPLYGHLKEFRIYDVALTAEQVESL